MNFIKETFDEKVKRNQKVVESSNLRAYLSTKQSKTTKFTTADAICVGNGQRRTKERITSRRSFTQSINYLLKNNQIVLPGYDISTIKLTKPPLYTAKLITLKDDNHDKNTNSA